MSKRRSATRLGPKQATVNSPGEDPARSAGDGLFFDHPLARSVVLLVLFVTALLVRLHRIDRPPLDFHGTRQYRSALIARGYYYETGAGASQAQKRSAIASQKRQGILEPPVMEMLACLAYRIAGGEHLWIPRLFSLTFWLVGGVFLYLLARRITSEDGALFTTAFYLLLPFTVMASTSFQPDPLMVMLIIISLFTTYRYYEDPSNRRLVVAGLAAGSAVFVKPFAVFFVFTTFLSLGICKQGVRRTLLSRQSLVFALTSLPPFLIFFIYGTYIKGFLTTQIKGTFLPHLLVQSFFWNGWLYMTQTVVGHVAVIAALLGTMAIPRGLGRSLLVGLIVGYCGFSLFCSYHTPTHNYYQLPFIPVIALGLGPVAASVLSRVGSVSRSWFYRLIVYAVLVLFLFTNIHGADWRQIKRDHKSSIKLWEEIGQVVRHSDKTIWLASNYGKPLQYHGGLAGENWPLGGDLRSEALTGRRSVAAVERFEKMRESIDAEYFIVVTAMVGRELKRQPGLQELLASRFPVFKRTRNYVIYDLR